MSALANVTYEVKIDGETVQEIYDPCPQCGFSYRYRVINASGITFDHVCHGCGTPRGDDEQ